MPDQTITCPHCGKKIELSGALTGEIEARLRLRFDNEMKESQKNLLQVHERELLDLEQKHQKEKATLENDARERARNALGLEMTDMKQQLQEKSQQLDKAREQELEVRKKARELEEKDRVRTLEMERTLDAQRSTIRLEATQKLSEEYHLKDQEKEKQLADMRKQIDDLKRKAELTSQQSQGEVQEVELETILSEVFRFDLIEPVAKGVRGADIVQIINDEGARRCGSIIWESKRTKAWSDGWVQKLKDDQRLSKAEIAVLVSSVLPKEVFRFGYYEGIWVSDFASVVGLATALRHNLIQVHRAGNSLKGKNEKMELIYAYLSGTAFRQRVEAIVDSFTSMKEDLDSERRSMMKIWAKREAQISRVIENTAGLYGEFQAIIGSALPDVKNLQLPPG